ncbi:hypothetical protein [Xanthomonas sp. 3075]|uniref:hypothetical protein n=1 Tax=Xanthomonas sp. 3075 TaxID=3035315 RepID=UPI00160D16AB|nr:hypothetical protein [Xanthomonas sp. 3075]MBB4130154.1 hypothetical protein [Xanthomonas sp. 3075]
MIDTNTGRDIFIASTLSAAHLGGLFGTAFDVPPDGIVLPEASHDQLHTAWAQPARMVIHALEPDGDFAFKLAIDLATPIATDRLVTLARTHRMTIAWAVDETSPLDDYYVVFPDGMTRMHRLVFRETDASYACLLAPAHACSGDPDERLSDP